MGYRPNDWVCLKCNRNYGNVPGKSVVCGMPRCGMVDCVRMTFRPGAASPCFAWAIGPNADDSLTDEIPVKSNWWSALTQPEPQRSSHVRDV